MVVRSVGSGVLAGRPVSVVMEVIAVLLYAIGGCDPRGVVVFVTM
jgi:hypothetical protein